jgi:hypothetical protein
VETTIRRKPGSAVMNPISIQASSASSRPDQQAAEGESCGRLAAVAPCKEKRRERQHERADEQERAEHVDQ